MQLPFPWFIEMKVRGVGKSCLFVSNLLFQQRYLWLFLTTSPL